MKRFFAPVAPNSNTLNLSPEDSNHAANVLRLPIGTQIIICNGSGIDYTCEISDISKHAVTAQIISETPCPAEPAVHVTLFQGLPKFDKMELIIQKCVELGVCEIVPVITERTIAKPAGKEAAKITRWQKIAESAAKQAGRGIIPTISNITSFTHSIELAKQSGIRLAAYENEQELTIKDFLQRQSALAERGTPGMPGLPITIALYIGPEGGFSDKEATTLKTTGITHVSLGKRILRTETAGITALTAIMYEFGEM